jgi:hypothetical protein
MDIMVAVHGVARIQVLPNPVLRVFETKNV